MVGNNYKPFLDPWQGLLLARSFATHRQTDLLRLKIPRQIEEERHLLSCAAGIHQGGDDNGA